MADVHLFIKLLYINCGVAVKRVVRRLVLADFIFTETKTWSLLKVRGEGPCPRRRQSCCLVGSKVFLFGGTSPSPNQDPDERAEHNLVDHSDLHILDMCESLAFSYNID